jgi:hypothetical protein
VASVHSPLPGNEDLLRDATIQEVFSASLLGGYISRPFTAELVEYRKLASPVLEKSQCVN